MSGIVGSSHNIRGSGIVAKLGTDGQVFTSSGAGLSQTFEDAAGGDVVDDTSPQLGGDLDCNGAQIQWSQIRIPDRATKCRFRRQAEPRAGWR